MGICVTLYYHKLKIYLEGVRLGFSYGTLSLVMEVSAYLQEGVFFRMMISENKHVLIFYDAFGAQVMSKVVYSCPVTP